MQITWPTLIARPRWHGGPAGQRVDDTLPLRTLSTLCAQRSSAPLIITEEELDWMLDQFEAVLDAATAAH
jgi:acetylornithine/succinyldiaminopimelate/putrescine aminotransferase